MTIPMHAPLPASARIAQGNTRPTRDHRDAELAALRQQLAALLDRLDRIDAATRLADGDLREQLRLELGLADQQARTFGDTDDQRLDQLTERAITLAGMWLAETTSAEVNPDAQSFWSRLSVRYRRTAGSLACALQAIRDGIGEPDGVTTTAKEYAAREIAVKALEDTGVDL